MQKIVRLLELMTKGQPWRFPLSQMLHDLKHLLERAHPSLRPSLAQAYLMGHLRQDRGHREHTADLLTTAETLIPLIVDVIEELLSYVHKPAPGTVPATPAQPPVLPAVRSEDASPTS